MSQYFGTGSDDVNTITISNHKVNRMTTVLNTLLCGNNSGLLW